MSTNTFLQFFNVKMKNSNLTYSNDRERDVIKSIGATGLRCCKGPNIRSCVLLAGTEGCPLNTLAHSIEIKNGSGDFLDFALFIFFDFQLF